jgi:glyoxylase-like metal-dependent hydrolase (beta-lactamase superfamily II)
MDHFKICTVCGTQYPSANPPAVCTICADDRQYIPDMGQSWITHAQLIQKHAVRIGKLQERVYELDISPVFGIGQRALFIESPGGNILWDCMSLLDPAAISFIRSKGGLKAIAFSHPHYYSNMSYWAETFNCPVYIHSNDEKWIVFPHQHLELWSGVEKELWDGMKIINTGGHFPGSSILYAPGLSPQGTIFCGDTFVISPDKNHVAIMYSYPNRIPLPVKEVQRIAQQMESLDFDNLYSFLRYLNIRGNAKQVFEESMKRYV